ncbi:unnamed protein product [Microthlaspi erraticum]|uniref:Glutaredoxin domain-containing protein n=1 Tax=Microthlaspi erraticum TaxID=1685480 RepID=A0A6D2HUF5_9BRAS|nr:unnamed protein product [Microthlaspi erraticum]
MGSSTSKTASSSSSPCSASSSPPEMKFISQFPSSSSSKTVPRAFSFPMPSIHHPPSKKGDTHHLVSLTSTTYGSPPLLDLDEASDSSQPLPHVSISGKNNKKTLETEDSLSPDSVINTWELMNGLDDYDEYGCVNGKRNSDVKYESFSKPINGSASKLDDSYEIVRIEEDEDDWIPLPSRPKQPLWKLLSEESFLSDLDPNIISSYKKALSSKRNTKPVSNQSVVISLPEYVSLEEQEKPRTPETEDNKKEIVLLYFTSLRGIRKTYEDCCCVRAILRGFHVALEERDTLIQPLWIGGPSQTFCARAGF